MKSAASAPQPGLKDRVPGVSSDRLPQVGDAGPAPSQPSSPEQLDLAQLPPVQRFASSFEPVAGKPLFAIILQDTGEMDRQTVLDIGFPVTIAIDPAVSGAAQSAQAWRDAGWEVLILATGLPEAATAADLEVTFQSHFTTLPEAVGVIDLPEGGFQNQRSAAQQVLDILHSDGYGLVTFERGVNSAADIARRDGIPQAEVFRELDGAAENADTIRRYLDRAAFKAAQTGSVVVMGRTRPETIRGLVEWAAAGRASTVALAPVTAVMAAP